MQDVITVSVVTLQPDWGDKASGLRRIADYAMQASKQGSDFLLLPEMCLTGYDDEPDTIREMTMQARLAETIPGAATLYIAELAARYGLYILFGMPERCGELLYNSLAVCTPEKEILSYRKIHLALAEPHWAVPGDTPLLLRTPWGPIGCLICYDVYSFPELMRYYAAKGCRLCVNATAFPGIRNPLRARTTVEAAVLQNDIYLASANLGGRDRVTDFLGGSSIIGPAQVYGQVHYYAGRTFDDPQAAELEMYTAAIDLSRAKRRIYQNNGHRPPDFRPDLYYHMYQELAKDQQDIEQTKSGGK